MIFARSKLLRHMFAAAFFLLAGSLCQAEPTWQFIRLTEVLRGEPTWQTSKGTAKVNIEKSRIKIEVFDVEGFAEPTLVIDGSIDSKGNIAAIGTHTHTDEKPFKLRGTLTTWQRVENWGGRNTLITYRDIVFPIHPHYELYGFISRTVEDAQAK